MGKRIQVIDYIKGLAIISVLLLHLLPEQTTPAVIWIVISQAVPTFMLVMGFNAALSSRMRPRSIRDYLKTRAKRILPFFAAAFAASLALGLALNIPIRIGGQQLIGYFPVPGAGNYFIPLVFQFVLLFPLMHYIYRRSPKASLLAFFGLNIAFEAGKIAGIQGIAVVYQYCIARFLALIWIGFFLAEKVARTGIKKRPEKATTLLKPLAVLGMASYHIFLTQILLFSEIGDALAIPTWTMAWLIIALGVSLYYLNKEMLAKNSWQASL